MSFLLDTDICSAHLRDNRLVTPRVEQYAGRLHVSVVTAAELVVWGLRRAATSKRKAAVYAFLSAVAVIDINRPIADRFGMLLRADQLDRGVPAPRLDLLIAATALVHNLTLVTHNTKDFANIPGLQMADWLAP
jgi:predicted nucleic acid-binding protein